MDCHSGKEPKSPLTHVGVPPHSQRGAQARGRARAGPRLQTAANRKGRAVYPELLAARRCKLVVLGIEVGGRIGREALGFVRQLANAKARGVPARLRAAAQQANIHGWRGMLAVAAQRAFAMSLLELPPATADECDGAEPPLAEVLADARAIEPIVPSRLPAPGRA